jgi:hypothetical protein
MLERVVFLFRLRPDFLRESKPFRKHKCARPPGTQLDNLSELSHRLREITRLPESDSEVAVNFKVFTVPLTRVSKGQLYLKSKGWVTD